MEMEHRLIETEKKGIQAIPTLDIQKYQYKELEQKVETLGKALCCSAN